MTAVLVLQCRDESLVDLDEPVVAYLPSCPWPDATLRHLLAHAGGLPAEPEGPWWERSDGGDIDDLLHRIDQQPLAVAAGSQHHYSNVGYALLGAVVERIRDGSWWEVLTERLLVPLGMDRTTYGPQPPHADGHSVHPWTGRLSAEPHTDTGAMAPAGQLWSTVGDLARWAGFLLEPDPAVLDPETLRQMTVPTAAAPGDLAGAYGLGLRLFHDGGRLRYGHGGSMPGFLAGIAVDPAERSGAFALADATVGDTPRLALTLLDTLRVAEPVVPSTWTPEPELAGADEIVGPWYWGNTPFRLLVRNGGLVLDTDGFDRGGRFEAAGTDRWTGLDDYFTGETLRVVRDPDGEVSHLLLATYELRRTPYA